MTPVTSPSGARVASQFIKFGIVGVLGLAANTAVVYLLDGPMGLYLSGVVAWVAAATLTWALHRSWTFRGPHGGGLRRQWARFLAANSVGFVVYYAVYAGLVSSCVRCAAQPLLAILAGAAVSLLVNFLLSRHLVFR